ncbi:Phosphoinositide phosphatase SAC2 [Linum perenne]
MDTSSLATSIAPSNSVYLQKFRLYETRLHFYMIGRDKSRTLWKVLKIDRSDLSELNILEDSTSYSESECCELLRRIHEGNKSIGGLKFVTVCYGIVGFVKFLGPYYMLLITQRRKIGAICGHSIYAITRSEMIPVPVRSNMTNSKDENRSFVHLACKWNKYLIKLSVSERDFKLTLIARRSRHYAGTRYLKRGVNEKGRVANDVETEQIVFEDSPEGYPVQLSSVVQNRGSIPLFWSQETSRLNIRPDITLSKKDKNYEATKLHFENLAKRYGNPIIILNLIKTHETRPRESILRAEFASAIRFINTSLPKEDRLRFLHWDLNKHSRRGTNVLSLLGRVAAYALNLTGIFYCNVSSSPGPDGLENKDCSKESPSGECDNFSDGAPGINCNSDSKESYKDKEPTLQKGVLRTNCIDCLDRTNVAQYAYGLAALGRQLDALGFMESPNVELDNPLAENLMRLYESMGDTLAHQYGGSAAHNKIFSERRGQWKAATQSQEFFRTLQRYYSNAYVDAQKQDAINVFLGHFQPQQGKPALWELDSDNHYNIGGRSPDLFAAETRSLFKRSMSDGNLLFDNENDSLDAPTRIGQNMLTEKQRGADKGLSDSSPEISTCDSDMSYSRFTPSMTPKQLFEDVEEDQRDRICSDQHGDACSCSNFLDLDWLSSSEVSCEEDPSDRSIAGLSSEYLANEVRTETSLAANEAGSSLKGGYHAARSSEFGCNELPGYSQRFVHWVNDGVTLFH